MTAVLALITARGGSVGIPGKNLAPVAGKPLLAWTIQASLASSAIHRTVVSTDDDLIALTARQWGAEVPFRRPPELAHNQSPHVPVVIHALDWLKDNEGYLPNYVVLLQPTSPLRRPEDIDRAVGLAVEKDANAVVSVCAVRNHPYLVKRCTAEGQLEDFAPSNLAYLRRQDLPPALALNGAIYVVRPSTLREHRTFLPPQTYPYLMPPERSLEIDDPWDLYLARLVMEERTWPSPSTLPAEK